MREGETKMASNQDWLPRREEQLANLMVVWQTRLANAASQTAYGWVAAECTSTVTTLTNFLTARTTYQSVPTKANADMKKEAKKAAEEAMRKFARERVRNNTKMTIAQREELGIFPHDPEPTPVPVPEKGPASAPEVDADLPGVVKVRYLGPKPYGVDWVDIAWGVLDAPVDSAEDVPHVESFSRNPWEHTFGHGERRKRFYYALRYRTKEGLSHWTEVREVTIP
jgi:hypothetical protein